MQRNQAGRTTGTVNGQHRAKIIKITAVRNDPGGDQFLGVSEYC
jgi:hypothetical protein